MALQLRGHARRTHRLAFLPMALMLVAGSALLLNLGSILCFGMPSQGAPQDKRLNRGKLHNKDQLQRQVAEIPLPAEEEPEEAVPEMPPYRPPYKLNIVSRATEHNPNFKYIERRVLDALRNTEDFIQSVDVTFEEHPHEHRFEAKTPKQVKEARDEDDEAVTRYHGTPAPFVVKAQLHFRNHKSVHIGDSEKHLRPTFTEAVDHFADTLRRVTRDEKEKDVKAQRKKSQKMSDIFDDDDADVVVARARL